MVVTPEPDHFPPRVRLDLETAGTDPVITSVGVTRIDPDGQFRKIRSNTGDTIPITGTITLYDYEAPLGYDVVYWFSNYNSSTLAFGQITPYETRLEGDTPWLVHVGAPALSTPIDFRIGTNQEEEWDLEQGIFRILGRDIPVVVTGSTRYAPASTLIVGTESEEERERLRLCLADGTPLLLNIPASMHLGIRTAYIAVGSVRPKRRSDIGSDPSWDFELPYQVVGRPAGGTQASISWDTVAGQYASWASLQPTIHTWSKLISPPPPA